MSASCEASSSSLPTMLAEFEVDREKRLERIKWLRHNGDRDVVLEELVLFSRRIDVLALQLVAQQKLAEASYLRSMTAGRRQCQQCVACRKYIPGGCLACGCPPLLHDKVSYTQHASESAQCDEQLGRRQTSEKMSSVSQKRPRPQAVRFTIDGDRPKASADPLPVSPTEADGALLPLAPADGWPRATGSLRRLSHLLRLRLTGPKRVTSDEVPLQPLT
eukprot:EG_transcript_20972